MKSLYTVVLAALISINSFTAQGAAPTTLSNADSSSCRRCHGTCCDENVNNEKSQVELIQIKSEDLGIELDSSPASEIQVFLPSQNKIVPMRCCKPHRCCSPLDPMCC